MVKITEEQLSKWNDFLLAFAPTEIASRELDEWNILWNIVQDIKKEMSLGDVIYVVNDQTQAHVVPSAVITVVHR